MFVTVWLGILELSSGRLTAANGGHEYPIICRNGQFEKLKDKHGLALGAMDNSRYRNYEVELAPGDKVFVYSDGIPEARNCSNEMYRMDRLVEAFNACREGSVKEIVQAVSTSLDEFVGEAQQFDDITMLSIEYRGNANEMEK